MPQTIPNSAALDRKDGDVLSSSKIRANRFSAAATGRGMVGGVCCEMPVCMPTPIWQEKIWGRYQEAMKEVDL